jgi:dihydrofolate reductase
MIGIIAAVSHNGVMGVDNKLPWDYPADMKYFRTTTAGANVIFGRKTFESIGRALPKRRNIVISRTKVDVVGVETFSSITEALAQIDEDNLTAMSAFTPASGITVIPANTWFCGGARVYEEAMDHADQIHLTVTPDVIRQDDAVRFPWINPRDWQPKSWVQLTPGDDTLRLYIYDRIAVL